MLRDLKIDVMRLQAILESRATHSGDYGENEYQELRDKIISQENLKDYIPDFLFICRTLDQFWNHVKSPKFTTYDQRRTFLLNSFNPLLSYLEQKKAIQIVPVQKAIQTVPVQKTIQTVPVQKTVIEKKEPVYEYDVALSFAGEDREVVDKIAKELKSNDISVFYDEFQKANLWGKKLSHYFKEMYGTKTRFVIVFISEHYASKDWTDFEFSIARQEAKTRKREFILPIRIDNTNIVGLHNDVCHLNLNEETVESIVETISDKLKT